MFKLTEILLFFAGYLLCLVQKGININIYNGEKPKKRKEKDESKYNESTVDLLPPELRQYYEQHNGMNKF